MLFSVKEIADWVYPDRNAKAYDKNAKKCTRQISSYLNVSIDPHSGSSLFEYLNLVTSAKKLSLKLGKISFPNKGNFKEFGKTAETTPNEHFILD